MSVDLVCTYCGILADTEDHVVPRHLLERAGELELDLSKVMRIRRWVVPACRECNSSLSGRLFPTLKERRAAAHQCIRRKYAAYLRIPDWEDDEVEEMGPIAQREIVAGIAIRDWVRTRLRWTGAREVEDIRAVYGLALDVVRARDRLEDSTDRGR
jgi:hypothetical protein